MYKYMINNNITSVGQKSKISIIGNFLSYRWSLCFKFVHLQVHVYLP